jgi:hypothetical protein
LATGEVFPRDCHIQELAGTASAAFKAIVLAELAAQSHGSKFRRRGWGAIPIGSIITDHFNSSGDGFSRRL